MLTLRQRFAVAEHWRDLSKLVCTYLVGQIVIALLFGLSWDVPTGGDTGSYLDAAARFPSTDSRTVASPLYVVILWMGEHLGSAMWFAMFVQTVAVLAAAYALLATCRRLGAGLFSWFAPTFFLVHPLVAQWWRYVLTEAIYISLVVLALCAMLATQRKNHQRWVAAIAVCTLFMRANGFFLAASLLSWVAVQSFGRRRGLAVSGVALLGVVVFFASVDVLGAIYGNDNTIGQRLVLGDVIWNDPSTRLDMPATELDMSNISNVVRYAAQHPVAVGEVAARRLVWELIQYRPWYSNSLNLVALATIPTLLALAVTGLTRPISRHLRAPFSVVVIPAALTICATWAVHEGRFGWWILAPALVPATLGLHTAATRIGLATPTTD